jgi:hypothetical protein
LRNRGVHPTTRDTEDVASLDYQRLIGELHRVTVLMYHIVFHLIGYRGPYPTMRRYDFPSGTILLPLRQRHLRQTPAACRLRVERMAA